MPKSKHRKSKTHFRRKRADNLIRDQVKNFWCADGTMLPKMISRSRDRTVVLPQATANKILKGSYSWQVIAIVFCQSDDELYHKVDILEESGTIKSLSPAIRKMCDRLIASQNEKHFVSYAWWASPAGDIDFSLMEKELVDMFAGYGAFDPELVNLNMVVRFPTNNEKET